MRTKIGFLACSLFLTVLVAAAQAPKPKEEHHTVTELLNRNISNMEHEFVPAAELGSGDELMLHVADISIQKFRDGVMFFFRFRCLCCRHQNGQKQATS